MSSLKPSSADYMIKHARKEQQFTERTIDSEVFPNQARYKNIKETPNSPRNLKIQEYSSDEDDNEVDYQYSNKKSSPSPDKYSYEESKTKERPAKNQDKHQRTLKQTGENKLTLNRESLKLRDNHSPTITDQRSIKDSKETSKFSKSKKTIKSRNSSPDSDSDLSEYSSDSPKASRQKSTIRARSKSVSKKQYEKSVALEKSVKRKDKSKKENKVKKESKQSESTLIQRLLLDITEKYKNINNAQSTCYINKLEKKTMVHEINTLAKALIKNEKRLVKTKDTYRKRLRDQRKDVKQMQQDCSRLDSEVIQLTEHLKQVKNNEEHLLHDLLKQQKIAKDSLRALENLSDKYDKEKRELIIRLEKDREDILKREEQKFELKLNSLKGLNDQMNQKLVNLCETEDDFQALQKNYNEAVQIIEDQKRELQQAMRDSDDLKTRNGQLDDEVRDVQAMLQEQQKIYSSHINELRLQLNELEDATRNKFEEQIVALQLDLRMKNEQLQRSIQDREQLEKKFKQRLEEAGMNTQQVQQEVFEKEEQREEMHRVMKNQEFEIEKLKRIIQNKEEETEVERRRFNQKWERKCEEEEKEKQEWNDMYQALQKELNSLRNQIQDKDNQLQLTMRRSAEGGSNGLAGSYKSSAQHSPNGKMIYIEGQNNNNQVIELQEQLKTKEEEIKILWNVIKEINKSKGNEKVSMEQLKHVISSKVNSNL